MLWNLPGNIMPPLNILIFFNLKLCTLEEKKIVFTKMWLNSIRTVCHIAYQYD